MDNNMNDLIKKAQEMIKNNQIPDEVKQLVGGMSSNNSSKSDVNYSVNNKPDGSSQNSSVNNSEIDMNMLMNMVKKINNNSTDDDMSRLLFALKPYLRTEKKEKIDEYVKLIKMGKMAQLFDILGKNK